MQEKSFLTAADIAAKLNISQAQAYKIIRELNQELHHLGLLTIRGRVNTDFFQKRFYYKEGG